MTILRLLLTLFLLSPRCTVMVDSHHPNTSVFTAKADQLIIITTKAGNNLVTQWFYGSRLGRIERLVGQCSTKML